MMEEDREIVELFFSCRGLKNKDILSKSDPMLTLKKFVND